MRLNFSIILTLFIVLNTNCEQNVAENPDLAEQLCIL